MSARGSCSPNSRIGDLAAAALEAQGAVDQAEASYRSTTAASLPEEIARAQSEVQSTRAALDAAQKVYESRKLLLEQGALRAPAGG